MNERPDSRDELRQRWIALSIEDEVNSAQLKDVQAQLDAMAIEPMSDAGEWKRRHDELQATLGGLLREGVEIEDRRNKLLQELT